jgi:hypothetical protein
MADPASIRATASRLQVEAGDLPSGLEALVAACGRDVWEGPAARRFLDDLVTRRRRLARASEEVWAVAARLHQQAAAAGRAVELT